MSSDLIALVVALTLGIAVVILGLRRNLSETTLNGLPRFGGSSDQETAMRELYGARGRRRSLSLRQWRVLVWFYLAVAVAQVVVAIVMSHEKTYPLIYAAMAAIAAVVLFLRKPQHPSDESAS